MDSLLTGALAPRSAFVGKPIWQVIALTPGLPDLSWWGWVLAGIAALIVYVVVLAAVWYAFLEFFDKRSKAEREFHDAEDRDDQARYLDSLVHGTASPLKFSEGDRALLRMLKAMVPEEGVGPKMLYVNHPVYGKANNLRPGGFALVMGPYADVAAYFKNRHWERLPFVFQGRHIYRKPM